MTEADRQQDELIVALIKRGALAGANAVLGREPQLSDKGRAFFNERADQWSAEAKALADEVAGRAVAARPRGL
jgi:hypothetical protein